jgi:hypothetical protein
VIGTSGTVGHSHHIPTVMTGWGVGATMLGRCANIGPASRCGVVAAGGLTMRHLMRCRLRLLFEPTSLRNVTAVRPTGWKLL